MTASPPMSGADAEAAVRLRALPASSRAMVAISSDVDGMTLETFREIHRYLNTDEQGPMGAGLGLDIADSMWVFTENVWPPLPQRMALVAGLGAGALLPHAEEMARYVRAGWIDTLHTYGNYSRAATTRTFFERGHAQYAMTLLNSLDIRLPVWVNHGNNQNRQNIGPEAWMEGDHPGSPAYHADLLRISAPDTCALIIVRRLLHRHLWTCVH